MKLDKIAFANIVRYIAGLQPQYDIDLHQLDSMIDIEIPQTEKVYADAAGIERMLCAIQNDRRIEAIKEHRSMTGFGLKESKDLIEKYWPKKTGPGYVKAELVTKLIESNYTVEEKAAIEHFLNKL